MKITQNNKKECVVCHEPMDLMQISICIKCGMICNLVCSEILDTVDEKGAKFLMDVKSDCCNADIEIISKLTCSEKCHIEYIRILEEKFGKVKKVTDSESRISYKVPTKDIIEKGLKWEDIKKYPLWNEG